MSVERYNAEHYSDRTAKAALDAVIREEKARGNLPWVYICSPYTGDTERNTERAQGHARFAFSQGYYPCAPHLYFPQFLDDNDPVQRNLGLSYALEWLAKCEEIWVFGDKISEGMKGEIAEAQRLGIPAKYYGKRDVMNKIERRNEHEHVCAETGG